MTRTRPAGAAAASAAALAITLAACAQPAAPSPGNASPSPASSTPTPTPASASVAASAAAAAAPDPNAPETIEAGDIPDNQVFVPYTSPDGRYTVSVPEGWARTGDGGAVAFSDKFNAVLVETLSRPGGAPDVASARADELPTLASTVAGFGPGEVTAVARKGGPAVLITYTGASPIDPVTGKSITTAVERYEFWRAGQEVVLTLSGAKGADNVDPWRIVSDSFRWR